MALSLSKDVASHPTEKMWTGMYNTLEGSILRTIVRKMDLTGVQMVMCVRRGESWNSRDYRTTVLVVYNSKEPPRHRKISTENIRKLLDTNNLLGVVIEFVRGEFARGGSSLGGKS
ncbi:hypothetical protein N7517_010287 [Penicillium concentricum]|uniref:Uncharacterized protein n=1 Tax=Penicillium concentricum TaxID=293559 RepID=A0A9W9RDT8_9EURO|nr:uncharacterized protein N7517_010287 [Penicillium concentricum]KAJ5355678.1 hypothetical protein N7517_010287 [Penicillium concentricum]